MAQRRLARPTRRSRIRRLFEQVAQASPAEAARLIEEARKSDPLACSRVEVLLPYLERGDGVLDHTPAQIAGLLDEGVAAPQRDAPPSTIGEFTVLREVGRGGMGVVYEAQQDFPSDG